MPEHHHHHHHHHKQREPPRRASSFSSVDSASCGGGHARRHHKHKHRSADEAAAGEAVAALRSRSETGAPGALADPHGARPRSFTLGQLGRPQARDLNGAGSASPAGRPHHAHHGHHAHSRSASPAAPRRHSTGSGGGSAPGGRHSSAAQALHHKHALALPGLGGLAAGSAGAAAVAAARPQRVLAEGVRPEHIAKGFALRWFRRSRVLNIADGSGRGPGAPAELLRGVPRAPGLHLWQWVPVHLAAAEDSLLASIAAYLHPNGSCGPPGHKQRVLLDLLCRGFALQVRYRPLKRGFPTAQEDCRAKLRLFDLALNDADNGGTRPIELPNGWAVLDYPLVVAPLVRCYEQLFGPRKLL